MRPANGRLATAAWIRSIPALSAGVGTGLPKDVASWATNGFIVVGPQIGGGLHPTVPFRSPVHQVDIYAVTPGSDAPPWGMAADLAEVIVSATYDMSLLGGPFTLKTGYGQARVQGVNIAGGPREQYGDPSAFAWYQIDLGTDWIAV